MVVGDRSTRRGKMMDEKKKRRSQEIVMSWGRQCVQR
jgi:hypothetical protein